MTLCRWAVVPDVSNAPRSFVTSLAQRPQGYIPEALNLRDKSLCHVRFNCIKLSCRDRTDFNVGPPKPPNAVSAVQHAVAHSAYKSDATWSGLRFCGSRKYSTDLPSLLVVRVETKAARFTSSHRQPWPAHTSRHAAMSGWRWRGQGRCGACLHLNYSYVTQQGGF